MSTSLISEWIFIALSNALTFELPYLSIKLILNRGYFHILTGTY